MNKLWARLSPKERKLALVTAGLAVAFLAFVSISPALAYLRDLDDQIASLEQETVNMVRQAARSAQVEERYRQLATQHSTALTEAQIYDGLQQELDRLAMNTADKRLVTIASRPAGHLTPFNGYREYQAGFEVSPTGIGAIAKFIRKLHESPQVLRIDKLELRRDPQSRGVSAVFVVTRTVVDRPEQVGETSSPEETPVAAPSEPAPQPEQEPELGVNLTQNPGFEQWDEKKHAFPGWQAKGCDLAQVTERATEGKAALKATAAKGKAEVMQVHTVVAGARYRASVDLAATGDVRLDIVNLDSGKPFEGGQTLKADGRMYRCALGEFVVPGKAGTEVKLAVPHISLRSEGAEIWMDNVVFERVK